MKIGVIGYGYVGSAVAASYNSGQVLISDPAYLNISWPIEALKNHCDAIFVCVPTPQSDNGACDTSILQSVIDQLAGYTGIVIAKSTASPMFYKQLEETSGLRLAHIPEFLTQANACYDYLFPSKIVIGCRPELAEAVTIAVMHSEIEFDGDIEYCSIAEAAMFKYLANTFLAMKVTINNEYYDLCEKIGINWNTISDIAKTDSRLGNTHWRVPGPDGSRGFGGACFPKDVSALYKISMDVKSDMSMLRSTIVKNALYRTDL
jgi:UDPglucose 6-dehydrogenase